MLDLTCTKMQIISHLTNFCFLPPPPLFPPSHSCKEGWTGVRCERVDESFFGDCNVHFLVCLSFRLSRCDIVASNTSHSFTESLFSLRLRGVSLAPYIASTTVPSQDRRHMPALLKHSILNVVKLIQFNCIRCVFHPHFKRVLQLKINVLFSWHAILKFLLTKW